MVIKVILEFELITAAADRGVEWKIFKGSLLFHISKTYIPQLINRSTTPWTTTNTIYLVF